MELTPKGDLMEELELADLNGFDRCDRCGSQAYVRVELYSKADLVFCGHHYEIHSEALDPVTLRVRDERKRLAGAVSINANAV